MNPEKKSEPFPPVDGVGMLHCGNFMLLERRCWLRSKFKRRAGCECSAFLIIDGLERNMAKLEVETSD